MSTMRAIIKTTLGGVSGNFTETIDVEGDGYAYHDPSVPAAKTGTLTTRTDNDTGTFTMTTGHGFSTSDKIDVFWSTGQRRNMTATVTGDSVVLDGGTGDNLPAATTSITASKPTVVAVTLTGDDALGVAVSTPKKGFIAFYDDAGTPALIKSYSFSEATGGGQSWVDGMDGATNPLAGVTVSLIKFSHGDSTSAQTMKAAVVTDS